MYKVIIQKQGAPDRVAIRSSDYRAALNSYYYRKNQLHKDEKIKLVYLIFTRLKVIQVTKKEFEKI